MKDGAKRAHRLWLPILAVLTLVLAGCTSSTPSLAGLDRSAPSAPHGTTGQAQVVPITPQVSIASEVATTRKNAAELTGQSCADAAARAMAAIAASLPPGTSSTPQHVSTCSDNQPLDVLYPATGAQTWTVTVKITAATATDCQLAASRASERCGPIEGHPGVIGAEANCSGIPCVQAWVFGDAFLVVVSASLSSFQPDRVGPQTPGGLGIGVAVLAALVT